MTPQREDDLLLDELRGFAALCHDSYTDEAKLRNWYGPGTDVATITHPTTGACVLIVWDAANVVIVARGTELQDVRDLRTDARIAQQHHIMGGAVHTGFLAQFESVKSEVARFVSALMNGERRLFACGHSLGGALATLLGDHVFGVRRVVTFGCPRIGDAAFVKAIEGRRGPNWLWRCVNRSDLVTRVPFGLWSTFTRWLCNPFRTPELAYRHAGRVLYLDRNSTLRADLCDAAIALDRVLGFRCDAVRCHSMAAYQRELARAHQA